MRLKALTLAVALAVSATSLVAQATSDSSAFIKAVRDSDYSRVVGLLGAPGSTVVNARDPGTGESALHITVRRRDVPWTNLMIQRGVNPEVSDKKGDTPLGLAVRLGFSEGARTLVANGAKIDGTNSRGETPLIIAVQSGVQSGRLDIVQMLARSGANPDKADTAAGFSAKDYARQDRRGAAILKVLEEKRPARKAGTPAVAKPQ